MFHNSSFYVIAFTDNYNILFISDYNLSLQKTKLIEFLKNDSNNKKKNKVRPRYLRNVLAILFYIKRIPCLFTI